MDINASPRSPRPPDLLAELRITLTQDRIFKIEHHGDVDAIYLLLRTRLEALFH